MQTRKCLKGENIPFRYKQKSNLLLDFNYLFFKNFKWIYIKNKNINFFNAKCNILIFFYLEIKY